MGTIRFVLNGADVAVAGVPPSTTLLEWLRANGLPGTKEGCAEGDCGACTVALRTPSGDGLHTRAVNACIMPLPMAHGAEVVTVEGIGDGPGGRRQARSRGGDGRLHPVQAAMVERHASQCGFCTPGIVMALWCRDPGTPADAQAISDRLAGNLCRCTGYGPILQAAGEAAAAADALADPAGDAAVAARLRATGPLDYAAAGRRFVAPDAEWRFAQTLAGHPDTTILSGATDVGLWITKRLFDPPLLVSTGALAPEPLAGMPAEAVAFYGRLPTPPLVADGLALSPMTVFGHGADILVGATVRHAAFAAEVAALSPPLVELMRRFGGVQVRNAGTVGGNIANGSPIGDLPPALIATGATLELGHWDGGRLLPLEDFFVAYGRQDRRPGEYVRAVHVPADSLARLTCHKVSKRFDSDISAVMAAFMLHIEDGIVSEARLAFGGMAGTPRRAAAAEDALTGRPYDEAAVAAAGAALREDFAPLSDQRASAAYRMRAAQNLLRRDWIERTQPDVATRLAGPVAARAA